MQTYNSLKTSHPKSVDRLSFIDFMLKFTGIIKRADISEMFNLSDAAASKTLSEYNELCPNNLEYNRTVRANAIVRNSYQSLLDFDAETSLGMLANGFNKNKLSSPAKTTIPFERIGRIPNNLRTESIAKITRAINGNYAITCCYNSENSENRKKRTIIPLAIMHDGTSWMFRGFHRDDADNINYKNFHFARVKDVEEHFNQKSFKATSKETLNGDKKWNLILPLQLRIHKDRTKEETNRIRTDFGIEADSNELTISTRAALLWIIEKKWFIDKTINKEKNQDEKSKKYYKFELINAEMIKLVQDNNL